MLRLYFQALIKNSEECSEELQKDMVLGGVVSFINKRKKNKEKKIDALLLAPKTHGGDIRIHNCHMLFCVLPKSSMKTLNLDNIALLGHFQQKNCQIVIVSHNSYCKTFYFTIIKLVRY